MNVSELVSSVDILQYISQFAEFTEKNGEYWALSPLKDEDTPSFSVNTQKNCFFDFSSGKGGNILDFIRCYHHCGESQAIHILQQYAGRSGVITGRHRMAASRVAKRFAPRKARSKQSKAVILPDNYMERYENAPDKLESWRAEGISDESMARFQVRYDRISNRIVFPIRNPQGQIMNVSGRTLDEDWKERGLRKYTYFQPLGIMDTLYGLSENGHSIMSSGEVIIFEGAKSVMLADTWGYSNSVAIMTSHLNLHQMKLLAMLGCRAVFALDKEIDVSQDEKVCKLCRYVPVEVVSDPEDLLQPKMAPVDAGKEVWERLYEHRKRLRVPPSAR